MDSQGPRITVDSDYRHEIKRRLLFGRASLVVQRVKCLPAMWETQVRSLDQEDPLDNPGQQDVSKSDTCFF